MAIPKNYKRWDFFISYASEDREDIARPLAHLLDERGYRVWFDEFTIEIGDSLNEKINEGLASSHCGIVIISHAFMQKKWPRNELNALVALEDNARQIIPIWHGIKASDLEHFNPVLADRRSLNTDQSLEKLVASIANTFGGVQTRDEPQTVEGLWNGISGRLRLSSVGDSQIVGEYDWFGRPWVGKIWGDYENRLFRFSWDWSLDETNGEGFLFRVSYRCDLRLKPNATLYRLLGGWVYQEKNRGQVFILDTTFPTSYNGSNHLQHVVKANL